MFYTYLRQMLRHRVAVAAALGFAAINAGGLGLGLLSLGPLIALVVGGQSLADLARASNAAGGSIPIPEAVVRRLPEGRFEGVLLLVAVVGALTIIGGVANFLHQFVAQTLATQTVARIRQQAFHHVVHLPLSTVIDRGPSEFVARIIRDAAELQRGLIALLSKALTQVLKGFAAFVVAFAVNWALALTATIAAPLLMIILRKLGKRIRRGTRGSLAAQEGLLRVATETLHGLRAVKANTGERQAGRRFNRLNKVVVAQELKVRTARALTPPVVETLAVLAVGGLALIAARHIIAGDLPVEEFVVAIGALALAGASFRPLAGLINEIHASEAPAERLAAITAEPREAPESGPRHRLPRHRRSIEFEDVSFAYPRAGQPALDRVTLRITHGERIAIVGPNGCGKTTLVSLLPRLLAPQIGRVLIDGVDISTVNLRELRRQIGVVTQETVLFRGSVWENIGFGAPHADREAVREAARRARADEFILELPQGYDTDLAEQGASLSGGQRQRLAIARAILRDPSILILDEATSQIDSESEAQITAALAEFCGGRTAILVAHRLSTVLSADRIVVMDRGRVVAQGLHEHLLDDCPQYQRLTQAQLA
jgi:ABC-type multidrug transport system fused ATPase/permease subunit